jgi:AraC-like DNA-binding protein
MKDIFETIFLLASIQGILLALVLFFRKENHSANIFLSFGIIAMSLELFTVVYYSKEWYYDYPWFMGATYSVSYLYGPIFYLYTKLLTKKIEHIKIINILHFIPFITGYLITMPIFLLPMPERIQYVKEYMIPNQAPLIYDIYEKLISVQGIIYTVLTILIVLEYNKKIKERFSNIDKINLNWLKYLIIGMVVCWSFAAASQVADIFIHGEKNFGIALHVAISILIYSIGYLGLKQPEIFIKQPDNGLSEPQSGKYKKSGLDDTAAEEIKSKLLTLMKSEKLYLDSGLTLNKLSELMLVSNHNLSEVINSKLGKTYYDFINEYRVEEFKKKLEDPSSQNYNLISIAFDSGFNSKTSFNTIFKKSTGQTPSEYKKSLLTKNI